jgi:hypothetical protein
LQEVFEQGQAADLAVRVAELGEASEFEPGCAASLLGCHASLEMVSFEQGEVGFEFLVEVPVVSAGAEEGSNAA